MKISKNEIETIKGKIDNESGKNKSIIYIQSEKEKTTSYINAILYFIGWMFIALLSFVFIVFAIIDFTNAIEEWKNEKLSKIDEFFAIFGLSLHILLYILVISVSVAKSIRYYISIRIYKSNENKEREQILAEINRKIKSNEDLTKNEQKIKAKEEKRKEKEKEKANKKKEKQNAKLEKRKKEIEEVQNDLKLKKEETNKELAKSNKEIEKIKEEKEKNIESEKTKEEKIEKVKNIESEKTKDKKQKSTKKLKEKTKKETKEDLEKETKEDLENEKIDNN